MTKPSIRDFEYFVNANGRYVAAFSHVTQALEYVRLKRQAGNQCETKYSITLKDGGIVLAGANGSCTSLPQ